MQIRISMTLFVWFQQGNTF